MENEQEITDGQVRRLQNLKMYRDKSPEEIRELLRNKPPSIKAPKQADRNYEDRYAEKLDLLKNEFGVDMNDSNDAQMLENLVRHILQSEDTHRDIRAIQDKEHKIKEDILNMKSLGEFQRDLQMTIKELQTELGITRKTRKEKALDDVPVFIDSLLRKAKDFWERETHRVMCPKDNIELVRYWLNFPQRTTVSTFVTECPQCGETITYSR